VLAGLEAEVELAEQSVEQVAQCRWVPVGRIVSCTGGGRSDILSFTIGDLLVRFGSRSSAGVGAPVGDRLPATRLAAGICGVIEGRRRSVAEGDRGTAADRSRRRKRNVMLAATISMLPLAGCSGEPKAVVTPPVVTPIRHEVVYAADGETTKTASYTLRSPDGGTVQGDIDLPLKNKNGDVWCGSEMPTRTATTLGQTSG
jgi:hypothetical protein